VVVVGVGIATHVAIRRPQSSRGHGGGAQLPGIADDWPASKSFARRTSGAAG